MTEECIFCKIGNGEISSDILYRGESSFVIRDISPKAPTHLLVIPTTHFTHLTEIDPAFFPVLGDMFQAVREMVKREHVDRSGYRLVINQGPDARQEVIHLHLHILAGKSLGGMG